MISDPTVADARYLEAQYRRAWDETPSPARTARLDAIVEAARDAGVYRLFIGLVDGRISPLS